MPGIGVQGVRGTAPCWTEADRADLSGGPPGAERGTRSVGRATLDKDTDMRLQEPPSESLEAQSQLAVARVADGSSSTRTDRWMILFWGVNERVCVLPHPLVGPLEFEHPRES